MAVNIDISSYSEKSGSGEFQTLSWSPTVVSTHALCRDNLVFRCYLGDASLSGIVTEWQPV